MSGRGRGRSCWSGEKILGELVGWHFHKCWIVKLRTECFRTDSLSPPSLSLLSLSLSPLSLSLSLVLSHKSMTQIARANEYMNIQRSHKPSSKTSWQNLENGQKYLSVRKDDLDNWFLKNKNVGLKFLPFRQNRKYFMTAANQGLSFN